MRSDAIFAVWHQGKDEYVERIEREVRNRLMGTNSLINGIRERLGEAGRTLFAWPPKFRLPSAFDHRHPALSRLAFVARHESILRYLGVRERRMAPLAERLRDGETLRLTHLDDDRFRLDASQRDDAPRPDTFPNWILTEESEDGAIARLSFDDYAWKDRMYAPNNLPLALAAVTGGGGSRRGPRRRAPAGAEARPALPGSAAGDGLPAGAAVHRLQRREGPGAPRRARPPAGCGVR